MATIITIASQKGGVGKTTTALNLGYGLSRAGKKTLVVDGDPQGGLSAACNLKKRTARGLLHLLKDASAGDSPSVSGLYHESLSILGNGVITGADTAFFEDAAAEGRLAEVLAGLADGYDYILLDAPVGVGAVVRSLLAVSDRYLIVINCKAGTMKTLPRLMRTADWVKKEVNRDLEFLGVLVNMYDPDSAPENKIYTYFKSSLARNFFFDTVIPLDERFETASFRSLPVALLQEGGEVLPSQEALAAELLAKTDGVADPAAGDLPAIREDGDDLFTELLAELCESNGYNGALLADEMGFPLTTHNCAIASDAMAAFTSVLGDTLEKAESVLDQEDANNITLEINECDMIGLHRFRALNSTYFLLVHCPRAAAFPGSIEMTAAEIRARLTA